MTLRVSPVDSLRNERDIRSRSPSVSTSPLGERGVDSRSVAQTLGDDLGDRRSLGDDVEDVGVILAALGLDQLGLRFVRHEGDPLGQAVDRARRDRAGADECRGERRLPRAVGAGDEPVFAGLDRPVDVVELEAPVEVDRQPVEPDHEQGAPQTMRFMSAM